VIVPQDHDFTFFPKPLQEENLSSDVIVIRSQAQHYEQRIQQAQSVLPKNPNPSPVNDYDQDLSQREAGSGAVETQTPQVAETQAVETTGQTQGLMLEKEGPNPPPVPSPQHIDLTIQRQGQDLHEILQMFRQISTEPLSSSLLQTPQHKDSDSQNKSPMETSSKATL
jgi:hypothetical protein